MTRLLTLIFIIFIIGTTLACGADFEASNPTERLPRSVSAWPEYGGGTGQRYVDATQINRDNVDDLEVAWIYRTGDVSAERSTEVRSPSAFARSIR